MLPVVWSAKAEEDLLSIVKYIGERNPWAAERMMQTLRTSTQMLSEHPYLYRTSDRVPGCREILAHRNYVVVYRVDLNCVRIMRIVHARRTQF